MDKQPYIIQTKTVETWHYNPEYGDGRKCVCGHPYHCHFDIWEAAIVCERCDCGRFEEKLSKAENPR